MILMTFGCSFADPEQSWTYWIENSYTDYKTYHYGMSSIGNPTIARILIEKVEHVLKTHSPEEIKVAVMWSDISRTEYYMPNTTQDQAARILRPAVATNNPFRWPLSDKTGLWSIISIGFLNRQNKIYFNNYYSDIHAVIQSLEIIHRTQLYLESKGIKYFMSSMNDKIHWFSKGNEMHPGVKQIRSLVDWSKFLPIDGCHEWVKNKAVNPFEGDDFHPTREQSKEFFDRVITPYVKKHKIL
jgi:hypothetical protein